MTTSDQTANERLIQLMGEIDEMERKIEISRVRVLHYLSFDKKTHDFEGLADNADIDILNLKAKKEIKQLEAKLKKLYSVHGSMVYPSGMNIFSLVGRDLDSEDVEKVRKASMEAGELSATLNKAEKY